MWGVMTNGEKKLYLTLLRNLGNYLMEEVPLLSRFAGGLGLPGRQSTRALWVTTVACMCSWRRESTVAGTQGRLNELPWEVRQRESTWGQPGKPYKEGFICDSECVSSNPYN